MIPLTRVVEGQLLTGRTAIVSGAGRERGIGKAVARLFVQHGASVVLLDVDEAEVVASAADVSRDPSLTLGIRCDVTDPESCRSAIDATLRWSGSKRRIDVLVNNAGITQKRSIADISVDDFTLVNDVVLRGTLNLTQAALPAMRAQRSGSIVNVASMSAQQGGGVFGGAHYCASKAGVLGLTRAVARELGPDGVRANAVAPGLIVTDFSRSGRSDEEKHALGAAWPLGRAGTRDEVASACLFLASDLSSYVTGTTLDVNGGAYLR